MTGNVATNRNKLVSFPGIENTGYIFFGYAVGHPLGVRQVLHFTGVDPQTGFYQFAAKNGDAANPNLNPFNGDRVISKPFAPSYTGGFENSISFKGIQLDFLFQFVKQLGNNYLYSNYTSGSPGSNAVNWPIENLNHWQHPGDITSIQKFTYFSNISSTYLAISDAVITDASFIRLKSLSITYSLPDSWTQKVHLSSSRIYLQCQNIFTITKYRGLDPETQGLGMPPMRTITAGFQFSL